MELPYIPHGTYLAPFASSLENPFDAPTAVYLGTLVPQWDHDVIFEAAVQLSLRGEQPRIEILGDGSERTRWEAYCAERDLDNVRFAGWQSGRQLQQRLRHAHVQLFPVRDTDLNRSRCPSKLFAYAQARRPLLVSRVGEVPEILGDAATYVEATPEAFADALSTAMTTALPDVDYAVERFSYGDRADQILTVLDGDPQRKRPHRRLL
jgi:glycosyltransferase involved in cell wall biosynthesis